MSHTKKLKVALPLDIINDASAYDKMPGIGSHPKGIHYYPARLPLPAARAILFSSLVDDPSAHPDKFTTKETLLAQAYQLAVCSSVRLLIEDMLTLLNWTGCLLKVSIVVLKRFELLGIEKPGQIFPCLFNSSGRCARTSPRGRLN